MISPEDRGLQYGDGLFETMRVESGGVLQWERHFARLQAGCRGLKINLDVAMLRSQYEAISNEILDGVLKLVVTRGVGERGYRTDADATMTIIWMNSAAPEIPLHYYDSGIDVCLCRTIVSRQPMLAGIKHLNRLENILARQEWQDEFQEGLMCDELGNIIEGTMTNFIALRGNTLMTPDLTFSGVAGIMRDQVLETAEEAGLQVDVCNIPVNEISRFDTILMTNSVVGVWPVKRIEQNQYSITPIARSIIDRFQIPKKNHA